MKVQCPQCECRHEFQVIDVDGVMSERELMHENLEYSRELEEHKRRSAIARKRNYYLECKLHEMELTVAASAARANGAVTRANVSSWETSEMIDHCQMLQNARDCFDRGMEEARAIATKYRDQFAPSDALPWDSKEPAPHCWQTCQEESCEECTALLHDGIIMGCDSCDLRGLTSADHHSWRIMPDGLVFCISCAEKTESQTP